MSTYLCFSLFLFVDSWITGWVFFLSFYFVGWGWECGEDEVKADWKITGMNGAQVNCLPENLNDGELCWVMT